jgi:hypothetical protein
MKLKCGNDVIDVPENKVAYFLHQGYVKVENEEAPKEPDKKSLFSKKLTSEKQEKDD